jgi:hypothetical protein
MVVTKLGIAFLVHITVVTFSFHPVFTVKLIVTLAIDAAAGGAMRVF